MSDYSCPRCGRVLKHLQLPGFCEGCGQPLIAPATSTRGPRFWRAFLAVAEFLAFGLALVVRANGAPFLGALVVVVLVNLAAALIYVLWHRALVPTGREIEQRGLVGVSKSFYERVIAPILYGKRRSG